MSTMSQEFTSPEMQREARRTSRLPLSTVKHTDTWDGIQATAERAPVVAPSARSEAYNVHLHPSIPRQDTVHYIDGTVTAESTHNVSRGNDLQHRIGSIPIRLQRPHRTGAQWNIQKHRTLNRKQRRLMEYNYRKSIEAGEYAREDGDTQAG